MEKMDHILDVQETYRGPQAVHGSDHCIYIHRDLNLFPKCISDSVFLQFLMNLRKN